MKGLRRKLLASITTLVVAIVSVAGSAYAWFTLSTTVDAKMEFEVVAGDGLEIAYQLTGMANPSAYSSSVNVPFETKLGAVTSKDGEVFDGIAVNGQNYSMDEATAKGWFEVTFFFRTQTDGELKLDTGTQVVKSAGETDGGTRVENAVRLSFEHDDKDTVIWEPNTKAANNKGSFGGTDLADAYTNNAGWQYFVQHAVGESEGEYDEDGNIITGYTEEDEPILSGNFIYNTTRVSALTNYLSDNTKGDFTGPNTIKGEDDIADLNTGSINGILFSEKDPDDGYLYASVKVRIWIEGFDADTYDEIYKQKFTVSLVFTKTTTNP